MNHIAVFSIALAAAFSLGVAPHARTAGTPSNPDVTRVAVEVDSETRRVEARREGDVRSGIGVQVDTNAQPNTGAPTGVDAVPAVEVDHTDAWRAVLRGERRLQIARLRAYAHARVFPETTFGLVW